MLDSINAENLYCAHNYSPLPIVLNKGEGVWLWDIEGKRYLDMMSAYSANSFGHCHPVLVGVLTQQAKTLSLVSRAFYSQNLGPYLAKLCQISGMDKALPMNTGVEAVETALKAARRWGYEKKGIPDNQAQIMVARNNFHGRTLGVISGSTDSSYKKHFGPLVPGFVDITFGDSEALSSAITDKTCAFLIEPIQGEAGIQIPPDGYLRECQKICHDNNVLFILDEVQSGLGRTGKCFAFQHENVKPDGLILGKALGGGLLPVSAFLARKAVMEVFTPGSHGSTFGGNPLACAVAQAALELLESEKLVERSHMLGEKFIKDLRAIQSPLITQIRGRGLWVGIDINPNRASARLVCEKLAELGVLTKDVHDTVIRLAPPLIIESKELDFAVQQLQAALKACQ